MWHMLRRTALPLLSATVVGWSFLAGTAAASPVLPDAVIPADPQPVLAPLATTSSPRPAQISKVLEPALTAAALGPRVSAEVIDPATGAVLHSQLAGRAAAPASTAKILTAAALLSLRRPEETLTTRVVTGSTAQQIVLVGAGDVLMGAGAGDPDAVIGRAGLGDLAAATAARLRADGVKSVSVLLDDSLFTGPAASAEWSPGDVAGGFVAPVQSIEIDSGNKTPGRRSAPGHPFPRVADPAMTAAQTFAARLSDEGVVVKGQPRRGVAPRGGKTLAEVDSATLAEMIEQALTDSDNTAAEALARLVAVSSNLPATFEGAGVGILATLARYDIDVDGQELAGGSGLGGGYRVSAHTLSRVLAAAAGPERPQWRPVITGLPVAGASGTLADRFDSPASSGANGVVRAKTGTLTGVSALAGVVVDVDQQLLAFSVLADQVPATDPARAALDRTAAVLAGCGCR